ncbi:Gluconate transport-inducing protein [Sporothrix eucalyptigena]|uniref:Gluconate transport-inducing protein n=1 Tax=Sporothrix eucalyptigena TaxID=1812306 RepID=A0ABP0B3U9_9PEZI
METYHGMVRTPADAIKLFEACRLGLLPRVQRRLSEKERQAIRSGSVFVWDEREAGMRRWTDGKSWSASRVSGSFLTYREMEGKRGGGFNTMRRVSGKTPDSSGRGSDEDQDDGEPDGYRYKADGLMKQSFSITTSNGQHLHLISYYARPGPGDPDLPQPIIDPSLRSVVPVKGMYPESSLSDNIPVTAVSRVSVSHQAPHGHHHQPPHYAHHPPPPPPPGHYPPGAYGQPGYSWPPSPIATPPYNNHYTTNSAPYPPQPPPPGHYSQTPPPPPPGYYPPHPSHAPYGGAPPPPLHALQYDRMPLPPPQNMAPARTTPPSYGQHPLSNSPRSAYHQAPVLPPVSTTGSGPSSAYQTSPTSDARLNLPPVSQGPLPGLAASASALVSGPSSTSGASSATIPAPAPSSGSSALTPPYQGQQSSQKPYYGDAAYAGGNSPSAAAVTAAGGNKASLSALLHPTPANSEPNSANAGSTTSTSSSPRNQNAAPAAAGTAGLPQQYLQPAPSGEDSRALSRLDKKFCI